MTTHKVPNRLVTNKSRICCNTRITRWTGSHGRKRTLKSPSATTSLSS